MEAKVISFQNNKGGVGKSVSVGFVSQLLAFLDKKVLVIDLDPQSNVTMMLGAFQEDSEEVMDGIAVPDNRNISDLLLKRTRVDDCIHDTIIDNLYIIPSSPRHSNTLLDLMDKPGNHKIILKQALQEIKKGFDFVIIDSAPTIDILTLNSLYAADFVYTPVDDSSFSFKGLRETIRLILRMKEKYDLSLEFGGAFLTRSEKNTNSFREYLEKYHNELGDYMMNTVISKDVKVKEVSSRAVPILSYCPNTNCVVDYANLILEMNILDKNSQQTLYNCIH